MWSNLNHEPPKSFSFDSLLSICYSWYNTYKKMPEKSDKDAVSFLFKTFCGLIRIRKTQTKRTDHYGRSRRTPAVMRHFSCIMWLQGEHTWFGEHFMPNAISMWQGVQDRCFVACLEQRKPWFGHRPVHLGFVVEKSEAGKGFSSTCPRFPLSVSLNQRSIHTFQSYTIEAM